MDKGKNTQVFENAMSWSEADAVCSHIGQHLIGIHNNTLQDDIKLHLRNNFHGLVYVAIRKTLTSAIHSVI